MTDPVGSLRRHSTSAVLIALVLLAVLTVLFTSYQHRASSSPATAPLVRPLAETPGSARAILFSTAVDRAADISFIRGQLELQHYSVEERTERNGQATAGAFKASLGMRRGILFVAGDGAPGFLAVERLPDSASCGHAVTGYMNAGTFKTGDITCHGSALGITGRGIQGSFQDTDTVVYLSACHSFSLQQSFSNARDFVGYQDCDDSPPAAAADRRFWSRLAGTTDAGRSRSTGAAADRGDYGPRWRFHHRPQTLATVLSPSVAETIPSPGAGYRVPGSTAGRVVFDARMDQSVTAGDMVAVSGCGAAVVNPHWVTTARGYSAVDFQLQLNTPGTALVVLHAASARAGRDFQNSLDGNQVPFGTDGVGPNGDDYVWTMSCLPGGNGPPLPVTSPSSAESSTTTLLAGTTTLSPPAAPPSGSGSANGSGTRRGTGNGTAPIAPPAASHPPPPRTAPGTSPPTRVTSSPPTCAVSSLQSTPAPAKQYATVQASAGLASISGVAVSNGSVSVGHFAVGTTSPVVLVATKADQTKPTQWSFDATDLAGRTTHCQ